MPDLLEDLTARLTKAVEGFDTLGGTLKVQLETGEVIYIDGTKKPAVVSNNAKDAACTILMDAETLRRITDGELNSNDAFRQGKIALKGDMTVAAKVRALMQLARED